MAGCFRFAALSLCLSSKIYSMMSFLPTIPTSFSSINFNLKRNAFLMLQISLRVSNSLSTSLGDYLTIHLFCQVPYLQFHQNLSFSEKNCKLSLSLKSENSLPLSKIIVLTLLVSIFPSDLITAWFIVRADLSFSLAAIRKRLLALARTCDDSILQRKAGRNTL